MPGHIFVDKFFKMIRRQSILQSLIFVASIPFLYFILTDEEYNWVYHASLSVILVCSTISLIDHWRSGNTKYVQSTLLKYGVIIVVCLSIALLIK